MSARCSLKRVSRVRTVSPKYSYSAVRQAVELFRDVHLGLRASDVGVGADDRTCVPHFA